MKDPYRQLVRPLLFRGVTLDPEFLHHRTMDLLTWLGQPGQHPIAARTRPWLRQQFCFSDPRLTQTCWGLNFANPLGLAAGFDKDGTAALTWPLLGFGFAELGTVTCHPQPGNPQPRLFRLVQDEAVLNRMGFNNQGSAALAARLATYWASDSGTDTRSESVPVSGTSQAIGRANRPAIPMGINLGKSKVTELADAADDYRVSFQRLYPYGDYFVVNVSSPNTPGLRSLQAADQLGPILAALQAENCDRKPILVKIAPDLAWPDIDAVIDLAMAHGLAGIIATNTTIARTGLKTQSLLQTGNRVAEEAGGISGAPLRQRSTEVIHYIYQRTGGSLPIVGVGGIFTAADAWEKLTAGATLLQVYTGWIYEGPWMVRRVLEGLLVKLEEHQLPDISAAVGLSHRS